MKIVAIVQARYHSTRLPKKILYTLKKKTVLSHVLERCKKINYVNEVCCAISDDNDSNIIEVEASKSGVRIFRGSEENVLKRYYEAAYSLNADIILRVTSDCPLIDPFICNEVIKNLVDNKADYSCNNLPPSWPHGLDCEAFSFEWLEKASNEAKTKFDLEHVTPYIRNHKKSKKVNLKCPKGDFKKLRWTLDNIEDLKFFEIIFRYINSENLSWEHPLGILKMYPSISKINQALVDKKRK